MKTVVMNLPEAALGIIRSGADWLLWPLDPQPNEMITRLIKFSGRGPYIGEITPSEDPVGTFVGSWTPPCAVGDTLILDEGRMERCCTHVKIAQIGPGPVPLRDFWEAVYLEVPSETAWAWLLEWERAR